MNIRQCSLLSGKWLAVVLLLSATFLCGGAAMARTAYAYDTLNEVCSQPGVDGSATCQARTPDNPLAGPNGLLIKIIRIIAMVGGIASVIIMIAAGINYMAANGDAQKTAHAKAMIRGALIGVVVLTLAATIVGFVVSRL